MILCDRDLRSLHQKLLDPVDDTMINPASIDIRIGKHLKVETSLGFQDVELYAGDRFIIDPGGFVLVDTFECLKVPNGYSVELKLKSSIARRGWNHSLAFWFDPGWIGIGTMEIQNVLKYHPLILEYGMKFGQIIVHRNSGDSDKPYQGRYQNATKVESEKPEKIV